VKLRKLRWETFDSHSCWGLWATRHTVERGARTGTWYIVYKGRDREHNAQPIATIEDITHCPYCGCSLT